MLGDLKVLVGGQRLWLSVHAVERYVERVKPHMSVEEARGDLVRLLVHGEVAPAPEWACDQGQRYVLLGDGIGFPLQENTLTSCVVRAGVGEAARAGRNARARDERQRHRYSGREPKSKRAKGRERARLERRRAKYGDAA